MKVLPKSALYRIRSPRHFYPHMRRDLKLLLAKRSYTSCVTLILCFLDAIAAGTGEAKRGKFEAFVEKYFPALCDQLKPSVPGKSGAYILYEKYRNGFAHLRMPKKGFAIADNHELYGRYAGSIDIKGYGLCFAINADRLIKDFVKLTLSLQRSAV